MRIIAVEKTEDALNKLQAKIREAFPDSVCIGFIDPLLAIKSFAECPPDLTVFSKDMRIIDGFTFARTLRSRYAGFTGVMLFDDEGLGGDASNYSLDFLVKPFNAEQLRCSWDKIRLADPK